MRLLSGISWDHPRGTAPLLACSDVYMESHNIRIVWKKQSLLGFALTPIETLADQYDLLIIDHPHIGEAARSSCLIALDEHLEATVLKDLSTESVGPSHRSYHYDGHQWALAVDAACHSSVARMDLLKAPMPDSWDGVLELGNHLRKNNQLLGLTLVPVSAICNFLTLCAVNEGAPGLNNQLVKPEIGLLALDMLHNLAVLAHPNSLEWNTAQLLNYMSEADDVPYCPLVFCYSNYARAGFAPNRLHFAPIPTGRGALLGGAGIAVSRKCSLPDQAIEFIRWLCSADVQSTTYVEAGGQPAHRQAWVNPGANDITYDFFVRLLPSIDEAYMRPRHPSFSEFLGEGGRIIVQFLQGTLSIRTCLAQLEKAYQHSMTKRQ